ncbi:MAG: low specificity L-threonine aldolase, partial [Planctomycetes bacterium]|nr:low specificity L-threonine aldolase [Planctomycetota bacterium]
KMFGGGMRQAGIIAAGALYALENNRTRLSEDHANAKKLAAAIERLPGVEIDLSEVETNLVVFTVTCMSAPELVEKLHAKGVQTLARSSTTIRAVTSLAVTDEQIDAAIGVFEEILSQST